MAVIQKTLFSKNLTNYSVLVNDTQTDSKYFKITQLPDTFTGGKNAFLIAGSEYLVPDTKIQIELIDASGNIIYHEPGEGMINTNISGSTNTSIITEYFEGVSKVVAIYVYPDTAFGPCTLTILGELSSYESDAGITSIVPLDWENKYNVKWQKQINVNPSLPNTTKIRFYQRPQASITEILSPIYRIESGSKVNSGVSQSFAEIKLSKLETFAGDVKRVKVFRTSQGDISDYDLIQDILVESKELLTSYGLSGSVVGETGILTSETLKNNWNTGSLNAFLTSSRVESGLRLTGSGYFTYTPSLDIKSANTYELNLDAFYSASISTNLGIYLVSGSASSSIATLNGTAPTKNLLDTVIPFKIDKDFVSASLYFSQSQGEWHVGNISLKLSEDTAFSPDEISFITTMPTVIGNETFNFKFEFYDVNNNFVPVSVTQSANFTGGANINNTLLLVSASTSQSLAALAAVSSSISGTMTVYSQSADTTITNVSSSISGSIISLSGSVSSSISTLSGSIANELILTSGSVLLLSGSFLQFTQSVSSSLNSLSQSVSSSIGTLSSSISSSIALNTSQSAFQVFSASQYLDKFIFTDENGKINQPPTASSPGLYLGSDHLGYFSGSDWKTYMDNQGDFYLTGSTNNFLAWSSQLGTLQVQGVINIQGGNAATTSSLNNATSSLLGSINSATASLSSSLSQNIFTDVSGNIVRPPNVRVGVSNGLFLGSTNLGYYSGSDWKTYMDNQGNFFLEGPGNNSLRWSNGSLSVNGSIGITGGNAATTSSVSTAQTTAINQAKADASASINILANGGWAAGSGTFITARSISSPVLAGNAGYISEILRVGENGITLDGGNKKIFVGTGTYSNANTPFFFASGSTNIFSLGDKLSWDGTTLSITGNITVSAGPVAAAISNLNSTTSSLNSSVSQINTATGSLTTAVNGKINSGGAASDVNSGVTKISGGQIVTDSITATQISGLNFTGKTATFDSGTIGGWTINSSNINKSGSTHTIKIDSANNAFTFTENSTSKLRLAITGSTNIPDISITSQDSVTFTYTGTNRYSIATTGPNTYNSGGDSNRILTATSGRGDGPVNLGYAGTGIIALTNPTEEIWVDTSEINASIFFMSLLNNVDTGDASSFTYQTYTLDLRVRKFADYTNANAQTNVITTYTRRLAELTRLQSGDEFAPTDTINVNGASIEVTSAGNWFKVDLVQNMQTIVFEGGTSIMASSTFGEDFDGAITVRFGQIGNGYSILGPGGIQVYQGFRNYMKSAVASAAGANFFEVQGKSTFLSGLSVSGSFSATTKQFQITHPLNEKKWLYHTSVESPRADLIYRGILQLENGSGSVDIDSSSRMTIGTFDILTKERQLFLQNNDSFDRVMGKIESGSLYVISENTNATASINWLVTAERNDIELQKSNTYFDGKYKVEKYKSIYLKEIDDEMMSKFSGSI